MNIAICEDNAADAAILREILQGYIYENGFTGDIATFASGETLLAAFSPGAFDLLFLDIYMGGITGMETAKQIRQTDPDCVLVFLTSSQDHALESYSVRAAAYVVKPIREKEMQTALQQCEPLFLKNARYIEIRTGRTDMLLPLVRIYYVEIYDKAALFHTTMDVYKTYMALDEIERQLAGAPFLRCHNSYIVNMSQVARVGAHELVMKNGDRVPVRSRGREEIRTAVAAHLTGRMFEVRG